MEPKKYWWIQCIVIQDDRVTETQDVTDTHPFLMLKKNVLLRNWKLITEQEYNLWQELSNK